MDTVRESRSDIWTATAPKLVRLPETTAVCPRKTKGVIARAAINATRVGLILMISS